MIRSWRVVVLFVLAASLLTGCGSAPKAKQTGFISDYSNLQTVEDGKMRYISPRLGDYDAFIVDPVVLRSMPSTELTNEQRAEAARYFQTKFIEVLRSNGYRVERNAGVGIARVRLALTDIQDATWWMNLHPGAKLTGAGVGGASMEGEVIDSVTGEQLGAVVKGGKGDQFELDTFDALDDVKDVIDKWADEAEKRLRELRANRTGDR